MFKYLEENFDLIGAGVFEYISFRAGIAAITSLIITLLLGKRIIGYLQKKQIGETVRELGLEGQKAKEGTPTMGGIIILLALVVPTLLYAKLENIYIILMLVTIVWMGTIGFIDDYLKAFKKNKAGLAARFKVMGQFGLGIIVGATLYFHEDVVVREFSGTTIENGREWQITKDIKAPVTTIPFVKNHKFNYAELLSWMGGNYHRWAWMVFIPVVILIIIAVSNGANITDGLDGLATGTSAIIVGTLGVSPGCPVTWYSATI